MTLEELEKIMEAEDGGSKICEEGCSTMKGLLLIRKYLPNSGIEGAGHDQIWSVEAEELIDAGLTEGDALELRAQNWMLDCGALSCFV